MHYVNVLTGSWLVRVESAQPGGGLVQACAALLIFLYIIVLVPDFFSTQAPERTDARQAFIPVQMVHLFDDGAIAPWVPAIVGKRHPVTLRMEWVADPQKKVRVYDEMAQLVRNRFQSQNLTVRASARVKART